MAHVLERRRHRLPDPRDHLAGRFEHYFDDFAEAPESRREVGAGYGLEVDLDRVAELCEEHGLRFPRPTDPRGPSDR